MKTANPKIENAIYKEGSMSLESITYTDESGVEKVAYTNKTVKEYLIENPDCKCIPMDQALNAIVEVEEKQLIKPWKKISESDWQYGLEVLPPEKWEDVEGVNIFRMSERTTGNITAHYARYQGKFYIANRRTSTDYESLACEVKNIKDK